VTRAETLKADPEFLGEIKRARSEWNLGFPDYSLDVGTSLSAVEDAGKRLSGGLSVYPVKLLEAIVAHDRLPKQKRRAEKRRSPTRWRLLGEAMAWWHDMLDSVTNRMWPPDDFPHAEPYHPAMLFVALCVICGTESTESDEYALTTKAFAHGPGPLWAPSPPGDRDVPGDKANLAVLVDKLRLVASGEASMTPYDAQQLLEVGELARHNVSEELLPHPKSGFWYVPITPGLTSAQWRTMQPRVLTASHVRFGPDVVDVRVRYWKERGLGPKAIAHRLGISDDKVSGSLKKKPQT